MVLIASHRCPGFICLFNREGWGSTSLHTRYYVIEAFHKGLSPNPFTQYVGLPLEAESCPYYLPSLPIAGFGCLSGSEFFLFVYVLDRPGRVSHPSLEESCGWSLSSFYLDPWNCPEAWLIWCLSKVLGPKAICTDCPFVLKKVKVAGQGGPCL